MTCGLCGAPLDGVPLYPGEQWEVLLVDASHVTRVRIQICRACGLKLWQKCNSEGFSELGKVR